MPDAILIAGPNGAGKTTFARQALHLKYPESTFLNADEIQQEGSEFAHPIAAGRELLNRLAECERRRETFAIETTLSSNSYKLRVEHWRGIGFKTILHFIELPSADFAIRRVALRVAAGGHSIPEVDIRRRFHRGLETFEFTFKPVVDEWYHWRSDDKGLKLIDEKH